MSKIRSRSTSAQILFLLIFVFSLNVFGQKNALENDLKKSFGRFDLVSAQANLMGKSGSPERLIVPTAQKTFELDLTPRDLRASRYRAEITVGSRTQTLASRQPVYTFKGRVAGAANSQVRLTIEGNSVEGFFADGADRFFIEPARNYSSLAADGDLIVYRSEDAIHDHEFSCDSDLGERIEGGKQMVAAQMSKAAGSLRTIELATEADYEYVRSVGSAEAANSKILGILNMVEGVYESQLGLSISVVFQHAWSSTDPYSSVTRNALLTSFKDHWNINYPKTQIPRDAAHLFTAKPNMMAQGLAYLGVICKPETATDSAYGFSGRLPVDWNWEAGNFLVTAHEIAHNLGANHVEPVSCPNSLMNPQLSNDTQFSFCSNSRTEITNYVAANNSCLEPRGNFAPRADFDGDGKSDVTVFRPSNGVWYVNKSSSGFNFFVFGQNGDKPVSADYDGDGKTDAAVFRGGVWYRLKSATNTFDSVGFGLPTDIPSPADFDGDGRADVNVFRPSIGTWFRQGSANGAFSAVQFGQNGDVPTAADYDGDGRADINLFRPTNGVWYRLNSRDNSFYAVQFGGGGDKAVSGDFDGDGKADIAVFRPSNGVWYVLRSSNNSFYGQGFGVATDTPTPADYDGDGKTDVGVFRSGTWFLLNSSNNAFAALSFGTEVDLPAQAF
jgi:hypothetical protein